MRTRRTPLLAIALLGAAATGCAGPPRLTESQEYYVGRGVAAQAILQSKGLVQDPALANYVNLVGQDLALGSDRPETFHGYHFGVLASDAVNAFAAPSGFIFVTTAALKAMQNEDELAGVLAHEIAHVNLRHPEDHATRATRKAGVMGILQSGAHLEQAGGVLAKILESMGHDDTAEKVKTTAENLAKVSKAYGGVLDGFLQEIMVDGYGRDSELAADAMAVDFLVRAGYDPEALRSFIIRLPAADRGAWTTHPGLQDRAQKLDDAIRRQGKHAAIHAARTKRFNAVTIGLRGS